MKKTFTLLMLLLLFGLMQRASFAQTVDVCDPAVPDVIPPAIGFRADYYAGTSFTTYKYSEYVSSVNFNWKAASPDTTVLTPGNYSIRYSGAIVVPVSGTYNFYITSNSGARLYINNRLSIDNWAARTALAGSRTMYLEAGKLMQVRLEYSSNKEESALIKLEWQSSGGTRKIIQYSDTKVGNSLTLALDETGKAYVTPEDLDPGFIDACGIGKLLVSKSSFDCSNLGDNTVLLTATDVNGNTTTVPSTVTIVDKINPSIIAPADITVNNGAKIILGSPITTDNCSGVQVTNDAPLVFPLGTSTVTWMATDAFGNKATATQVVTVNKPLVTVTTPANIIKATDNGKAGAVVTYEVTAGENADGVTISQTAGLPSGSLFPVGITENTFVATDASGNIASASFTVTVEDTEAPVASVKDLETLTGTCQVIVSVVPTAQDNVDGAIKATTNDALSFTAPGTYAITWAYTDSKGNTSTQVQKVVVNNLEAPTILVVRTDKTFTGENNETIILGYGAQSLQLSASAVTEGVTYSWSVSPVAGLSSKTGSSTTFNPTVAGSYVITLKASVGASCTAIKTVVINVIDVRCETNGEMDKVLVCHNGKVICIAGPAVKAHLRHEGDVLGDCPAPTKDNDKNGSKDKDKQDNKDSSKDKDDEYLSDKSLAAFPNPFSTRTTIEFTPSEAGDYTLEIYTMQGALKKVVSKGKVKANQNYKYVLEAGSYKEGIYMIKLTMGRQVITKRLVINK